MNEQKHESHLYKKAKDENKKEEKMEHKYLITQFYNEGADSGFEKIISHDNGRVFFNDLLRAEIAARNMIKSVCEKNEIDVILKIVKVDFTEVKEFCLIKRE